MDDEQILVAAGQLWSEKRGSGFTMEQLAEVTGVSRATLYRRFGSREAIVRRLVEDSALDVQDVSLSDFRTRILDAARVVFSRYGLVGATVEQIAQEAAVGHATVYRHFGSKEKLIEAFVQTISVPRQLLRDLRSHETSDVQADLTRIAMALLAFIGENRDLIRITMVDRQGAEQLLGPIRVAQGRTVSMLANYLGGQMALGKLNQGDAFELALAFTSMIFGFAFVGPTFYEHPVADPARVAEMVTNVFLNGVKRGNCEEGEEKMEERS